MRNYSSQLIDSSLLFEFYTDIISTKPAEFSKLKALYGTCFGSVPLVQKPALVISRSLAQNQQSSSP